MSDKSRRVIFAALLLAGAGAYQLWAAPHMPWHGDFWTWANAGQTHLGGPLAIVSAGLLTVGIIALLLTLIGPRRSRSAHDAQAIGCLWIVLVGLAAMLALLALGMLAGIGWIVKAISSITLVTGAVLILGLAAEGWKALRNRQR